jgi:hypothetical protein
MADDIGVAITGDREVGIKFDTFPAQCHDELLAVVQADTPQLASRVASAAPSLTGKLRSEVSHAVFDDKTRITGAVFIRGKDGNDFAKAGALEFGAHGRAKVKAHEATLDHVFGERLDAPMKVMVEAYSRQTNIAARRFERGPLADMASKIEGDLQAAVERSIGPTK